MATQEKNPWAVPLPELERMHADAGLPPEVKQFYQAWDEFKAANPTFQQNDENMKAVFSCLANPLIATAQEFKQAFALATYDKLIAPSDAVPSVDPKDAWTADLNTLHDAAFGRTQETEWNMPLEKLADAVGIKSDIPNEWQIPLAELAEKAGIK